MLRRWYLTFGEKGSFGLWYSLVWVLKCNISVYIWTYTDSFTSTMSFQLLPNHAPICMLLWSANLPNVIEKSLWLHIHDICACDKSNPKRKTERISLNHVDSPYKEPVTREMFQFDDVMHDDVIKWNYFPRYGINFNNETNQFDRSITFLVAI